jgi:hypothetical protein
LQNTLFSAIIATFIIEIYKTLRPPNVDDQSFHPSSIAIRINIVLFLSFFLSMTSAVACALIQQWCREYAEHAYPRAAPHECGRIRTYLFRGLDRFQMKRFMYGTHVLLHLSLFLFFWAISDFFYTVHTLVGTVSRYCVVAAVAVYMTLSIFPLIFSDSPYNTPLTNPLRASGMLLLYGFRFVSWYLRKWRNNNGDNTLKLTRRPYFKGIRFDRSHLLSLEAKNRAADLERYAMGWLFTENDFSDRDMDKFLEGLPGYISSRHTKEGQLDTYITSNYILERIREHFLTCATSSELSDEESITRVLHCVESLRLIFRRDTKSDQDPSDLDDAKLELQKTYIEAIIGSLQTLCECEDRSVALRASCIRALAVHGLLTQITSEANKTSGRLFDKIPHRLFSKHLIPLYVLFFQYDAENAIAQLDVNSLSGDNDRMWKVLLCDGPLVNLTMLAEAVRPGDHVPPSSLSFCWKALDILLKQLEIGRSEASSSTLNRLNCVHDATRDYVQNQELGFRIAPLLEILDAVARGRRLSLAFLEHPEYHSRADVIFGKERLWKGDLLEACARCLPDYISKVSTEKGMEFMEGIVADDDLWTSLQVNLWNAQRSYHPTPDKLRIFKDCCTVLDVAFSSLESSTKVDWRAPEFGSLTQQFESFIAHCFQDSFMGRATSLRVGTIRAQCCKALLAQFRNDVGRGGTLFLRSQWDVASLARLFWTLEIGEKQDAEFWKYYTNGGHIRPDFTTKARETISRAACDGPLLIFCKLGRLAMTAVPLHGPGLEAEDLEKVWKLQRNMIEDQRLPLNHATEKVWEKLGRLRADVSRLCSNMPSEDQERLWPLREMLVELHRLDPNVLSSNEDAERQSPVTPTLPPREQRRNVNRWSSSSESTAVSERRSGVTQSHEDTLGGASS